MNRSIRSRRSSRGLSLIELLVAVALGGILMGGAISLFVNNRATYEVTNDMARLQENARFALQVMTEDLRMAGHVGCVNQLSDDTVVNTVGGLGVNDLASFTTAIEGIQNNSGAWQPSGTAGTFAANSDAITVRYIAGDRTATGGDVNNEVINELPTDASEVNPVLQVRALNTDIVAGQLYSVSDCGSANLFIVNSATQDSGTGVWTITAGDGGTGSGLRRSFQLTNKAIVAPVRGVRYTVRDNDAGVPALFRTTYADDDPTNESDEELVDGVESLQVLYGVRGSAGTVSYLRAGETIIDPDDATLSLSVQTAAQFNSVVSIKIALLMRTVDQFGNVPDDVVLDVADERFCSPGVVAIPGCTIFLPADRFRRRVFQSTVAVRNFQ